MLKHVGLFSNRIGYIEGKSSRMTSGVTNSSLVICLEHLHFVLKWFSLLEGTSRTLVSSRTEKFKCLVETDRKAHRKLICEWMIEGNALT